MTEHPPSGDATADGDATTGRDGPPDLLFAVVAGWYVAALLVPAAVGGLATATDASAGALYLSLLALFAAVMGVASVVVQRRGHGLPERLGGTAWRWLLPALSAVYLLGFLAAALPGVPGVVVLLSVLALPAAGFAGLGLAAMAGNRYTDALLVGTERGVEWRARQCPRRRRQATVVAAVLFLFALAALAAEALWHVEWLGFAWPLAPGVASLVASHHLNRLTYEVTGAGLLVASPMAKRVVPYDALSGVRVTDEALVVERRSRWRPAIRCDLADVEDVDAVVDALDRGLQRSATS